LREASRRLRCGLVPDHVGGVPVDRTQQCVTVQYVGTDGDRAPISDELLFGGIADDGDHLMSCDGQRRQQRKPDRTGRPGQHYLHRP
jgi:hypothetical protein